MARYRPIYTKFWKDQRVQDFSTNDKLLFLYLLTNEQLSESGVYPITPKTISQETGLDIKVIIKGLTRGLQGAVEYDTKENMVWVVNFLKYQQNRSPNMIKSIRNDIKFHSKSHIISKFIKHYNIIIADINLNLKPNPNPNPNPIGGLTSPLQAPSNEGQVIKPILGETIEEYRLRLKRLQEVK